MLRYVYIEGMRSNFTLCMVRAYTSSRAHKAYNTHIVLVTSCPSPLTRAPLVSALQVLACVVYLDPARLTLGHAYIHAYDVYTDMHIHYNVTDTYTK